MKVVFLNVWHAKRRLELELFISQHASSTDVFCFQEAEEASRQTFRALLPGFSERSVDKPIDEREWFASATYVAKQVPVTTTEVLFEHPLDVGVALVTKCVVGGRELAVINMHGISYRVDTKLDTLARLRQTEELIAYCQSLGCPFILGGDFNLLPAAESITRFAEAGYQNLIDAYDIPTTRNHYAWDRYPDNPQRYADYVFASSKINIAAFEVPQLEISDHLPLVVEFEVASLKNPKNNTRLK